MVLGAYHFTEQGMGAQRDIRKSRHIKGGTVVVAVVHAVSHCEVTAFQAMLGCHFVHVAEEALQRNGYFFAQEQSPRPFLQC